MPMRWCICRGCPACGDGCGQLYDLDTTATQRCPPCQAEATRRRNARPSSSSRGLGWTFSRRKQNDRGYQAAATCQCTGCHWHGSGLCGRTFTASNPKTGGHTVPRSQGGSTSAIRAVCRSCNSSDGGTLAHGSNTQ
jgi:hypothetical protein